MEMKFCWVTLNVSDLEASRAFYQKLLGLEVSRRLKPTPETEIVFLGAGETKVELVQGPHGGDIPCGQSVSIGFEVPSLDEISGRLADLGIAVHSGPFQPNPHIRFLYVEDPDGMRVQLVENM